MAVEMLGGAVLATMLMVASAQGQNLAPIGGPANPPPASFQGQQFVDSRGCVFLRAGFGGNVNWVARVDRNHKPICGMPRTGGAAAAQAALAADMAPDPQAMPQVQSQVRRQVMKSSGGQIVVPVLTAQQPVAQQQVAQSRALPKPPKGWVYAWKDDRLNPLRGIGTVQGQTQQDKVWTRTVPMFLVSDFPKKPAPTKPATLRTTVSTMSALVAKPASPKSAGAAKQAASVAIGALLVQVGSFGDPSNAQRAADRLAVLGLPVATTTLTRNGKTLKVVYAGPFASAGQAQAGLATLHGAGFGDAFLR